MTVRIPDGMPPWWNKAIYCRHCGVYIIAFTPKHPNAWQRELDALTERASERCYCQKPLAELLELSSQPEQFNEHTLLRNWISNGIRHRYSLGEKPPAGWVPHKHTAEKGQEGETVRIWGKTYKTDKDGKPTGRGRSSKR